jgi:Family of unknown function (DUF6011)
VGASPGQVKFMEALLVQRVVPQKLRERALARAATDTPKQFSGIIDDLRLCPWLPKPTLGIGTYLVEGIVYKVVKGRQRGKLYAQVLKDGSFTYESGALFRLPLDSQPVTLQQALSYGLAHGQCIYCGHSLTAVKSLLLAIGPVCARRELGLTQVQLVKAQQVFAEPAPSHEHALVF